MKWWKTESDSDKKGTAASNETQAPTTAVPATAPPQEPEQRIDPATEHRGVVIAVGNQKGGVGKTTNTVHLAAALGLRGHKCLIIDLDPAAGSTKHFGITPSEYQGSLELLAGKANLESLVITEGLPKGVHLIPSRPQLSELDTLLSKFVDKMKLLAAPLADARRRYDYIFLDTPPISASTPTMAAYASAEWFLLCAFAHPLSLGGLTEAFRDITDVRQYQNPNLTILGVVFSNVDVRARNLRGGMEMAIDNALPGRRFNSWISQAVVVPECSGKGITVFQLPGGERNKVARQYMALAQEIEDRVQNREAFLQATEGALRCA
jgi:chromosome partitioning protein